MLLVKMKILCCLVLVFTGVTLAAVQPKSVNLALETVLQFDKKNHVADLEVITRVQKFLDNIKDVMSVYDGPKPSRRSSHQSLKFTDFVLEVVNIVRAYNDSDLKQIITVLDDEARKYNYKGCKFYELLDNRSLRKFMSRNLEDAKEIPLEKLRNLLDTVANGIENQTFQKDEKKLLSLVNSLYTGSEKRFTQVLSNLNNYGTRRFTLRPNLRDIISKGLKTVVFDFYSKLSPSARMSLKSAVHNYWKYYLGGKDRQSIVASTKRELKSNFIDIVDITRYNNNDMHKWSARAKRTKHIVMTTPSLRVNKSLYLKANSHKRDSLGLSVDLNSLKPVFESFFKKITFDTDTEKQKKDSPVKPVTEKTKTKHKNTKHSKEEALDSFIQAKPMPDSVEASEGHAGHGKLRTVMVPYDEHQTKTKKKKHARTSRNRDQIRLDNFLKSKSEIRSEIRDLNEIQKKYDKLRKLQSNLSPEVKSEKEDKEVEEEDMSEFEFITGGQKVQEGTKAKLPKRERMYSKRTPDRENEAKTASDYQAVTEVTESIEFRPKKRLRTPHTTATKPKKHRKQHKTLTSMFYLRSGKKQPRSASSKPAQASKEGMSIASHETENSNQHSEISIKEGETESITENSNPRSEKESNVVSMLHKLEKELEDVKSKIKCDTTPSNTADVTSESHSIESRTDTVPSVDRLQFWSGTKTVKTKTIRDTTLKVISHGKKSGRRDRFPRHGSKYLQDPLFESKNNTHNSKNVSPLQSHLNQTMGSISSYINETISTNKNNYNATGIDFEISDDQSNERTESVTTTTVTKVSKSIQESLEKGHNKGTSKEKPKRGPQSLEEEKKALSKEKVSKGPQSLEGETKTTSNEKVLKGSQSLKEGEKKMISKEMLHKGSQSLEEGEKKTLSKEKVSNGTQSLEDLEKITVSNENVQNISQPLEGEKITVSKEKVENSSQSLEELEKIIVSQEKVKNETQTVKEIEKITTPKENVGEGSQSLEEGEHRVAVPIGKLTKELSAENEKMTVSKEKVKKVQSSEEGEKVSNENIGYGSLLVPKDKNDTKSHDNKGEPDSSKTATTPTIGNVSLTTSMINDIIKKTDNEDAEKNIGMLKDERRSNNNNSGMIPPDDPARNDLLGDDPGY